MWRAVYNLAIPYSILTSVGRHAALVMRGLSLGILLTLITAITAHAADWSGAEQQLARKVASVTGPGIIALTFENQSSLGPRDSEIVQNGLRAALEQAGIHFVRPEQAAASVAITLSENVTSYVWVAQIHQSAAESAVVMVSVPRSGRLNAVHDSMPITLRKSVIWSQTDPILDVAVLEEAASPTRIVVLSPQNVSFYRSTGGKRQPEQVLAISHTKPWPLDLRGRLVVTKDRLIDAYLPGVICHMGAGTTVAINCGEGDDPWPISQAWMFAGPAFPAATTSGSSIAVPTLSAFYAPTRNFFTGVLAPAIGKFTTVPKFYSAAFVPRGRYALWLFAATDGKIHFLDGMNDQVSSLNWGSDIVTVRTSCGAGWQVLAASSGRQSTDSVRAYEFPDRDAVAVSPSMELPGTISAMWAEAKGDTAIAVVNDRESGNYEAYRVAMACGQ